MNESSTGSTSSADPRPTGRPTPRRRARILATLGPATDAPGVLRDLVRAGADSFRINLSHGSAEEHERRIEEVRAVSEAENRAVAVMMDLGGPKIRTGEMQPGVELERGRRVEIVDEEVVGDANRFCSTLRGWVGEIGPGSRILLDDGKIELRAISASPGRLEAEVTVGGPLGSRKGINLPDVELSIPSLTDKDRRDIELGVRCGVDAFALSFVRRPEDLDVAKAAIEGAGGDAPVLAKIEKPEAVDRIDAILESSDGILLARGDLAVETSHEAVPVLQKRILAAAARSRKIVITATQMLQSMIEAERPTRAEVSDIANAVFDGSDGLLLTGETAIGKHPVEVVRVMDRVMVAAEGGPEGDRTRLGLAGRASSGSYRHALAEAAAYAAKEMKLPSVVVFTRSGRMARHLSALRPGRRIVALTPRESTRRRLSLVWGVEAHRMDFPDTARDRIRAADRRLVREGLATPGDEMIFMTGQLGDHLSRMIQIRRIES